MRVCYLTILLSYLSIVTLGAKERSESEMKAIAIDYVLSKHIQNAKGHYVKPSARQVARIGQVALYEVDNSVTVFMASDSDVKPILGYVIGHIDNPDEMPCGLKWWINETNTMIAGTKSQHDVLYSSTLTDSNQSVKPILKSYWDQGTPYNLLAPKINGYATPTGCGATALAQLIYHFKYPEKVSFMGEYSLDGLPQSGGRIRTTYNYEDMKPAYGNYYPNGVDKVYSPFNQNESNAVATLMRDCGYASKMDYTLSGSGVNMFNLADGLVSCFKYPQKSIKYLNRDFYTNNEWYDIIYHELSIGSPILYGGTTKNNEGHAFIIHGVDSDGMFLVNWGWAGLFDGYYSMDLLNPDEYEFSSLQDAIIGIRTDALPSDVEKSIWSCEYYMTDNFSGNIIFTYDDLYNRSCYDFDGDIKLVAINTQSSEDRIEYIIHSTSNDNNTPIKPFYGLYGKTEVLNDVLSLKSGQVYKVYMASLATNDNSEQMIRSRGGSRYYLVSVDNNGRYNISGKGIEDFTDGITCVTVKKESSVTYNISGQRVSKDYRGITISNGRKVIMR